MTFKKGDKNIAKRPEVREKNRQFHLGKKLSKESIIKRTETRRKNGWNKNPEETKRKKRKSALEQFKDGMPEETKKKLRKIKLGKKIPKSSEKLKRLYKEGKLTVWNKNKKGSQVAWNKGKPNYEIRGDNNPAKRIEVREKIGIAVTGEKNGQWQGGTSFEPYTKEFNNKFKRAIRKRDNQICMLCGIHREKLNKSLFIHHINYNKEISLPQNCLSLCNSCHTKTNSNRKYWISFFQSLLSEKYRYEYSKDQEIIIGQHNEKFK